MNSTEQFVSLLYMRFLRITGRILLSIVLMLAVILAICLAPVDDTPYRQTDFYRQTTRELAALPRPLAPRGPLRAGWAKVNLTPGFTTPTGGYGVRGGKHWEAVADSIYVRAVVLDNGSSRVALIALDLLITPPTVTAELKRLLPTIGWKWEQIYTGAIHSHNSLGGFAPGLVGNLFSGDYDPRVVQHITSTILTAIQQASQQMEPVTIGYTEVNAPDLVYNRLDKTAPTDAIVRLVKLQKQSGQSALLCTFGAHATLIDIRKYQILSRDYPGALLDRIEHRTGQFALFMAGSVGSTGPEAAGATPENNVQRFADTLSTRILAALPAIHSRPGAAPPDSALSLLTLPLHLREPQARVLGNWCVRPFVFHSIYGDFPSDLKALRIGPTIWLGAPCDFSGMLASPLLRTASQQGDKLLITSFNGGYIGYITPDKYYESGTYETQIMNWFGPQNGAYFTELMTGLVTRLRR